MCLVNERNMLEWKIYLTYSESNKFSIPECQGACALLFPGTRYKRMLVSAHSFIRSSFVDAEEYLALTWDALYSFLRGTQRAIH